LRRPLLNTAGSTRWSLAGDAYERPVRDDGTALLPQMHQVCQVVILFLRERQRRAEVLRRRADAASPS